MPTLPSFNLYEELELTKTATSEEITTSYRRLALVHHPDKNGNSVEATAKFQHLQAAYQTLKDENTRRQYDSPPSSRSSSGTYSGGSSSPPYHGRDSFDSTDGFDFDDFFEFAARGDFGFFFRRYGPSANASEIPTEEQKRESRRKAREQEDADRKQREKEYQEKYAKEEAKREAMEEMKRKQQQKEEKTKEAKTKVERLGQEKVWATHGATTIELKQKFCDHTEIWPKEQSKKKGEKVKCDSCRKKRGTTSFKCPHCELVACQVCLNNFAAKRAKSGLSAKSKS